MPEFSDEAALWIIGGGMFALMMPVAVQVFFVVGAAAFVADELASWRIRRGR